MTTQFFNPEHMSQIAQFYSELNDLIKECDFNPIGTSKGDLFVNDVSITIRHGDGWNVGRFVMEDGMVIFDMDLPEDEA